MALRRTGTDENGDPIYEDTNADEQGHLPTEADYEPPDSPANSTPTNPGTNPAWPGPIPTYAPAVPSGPTVQGPTPSGNDPGGAIGPSIDQMGLQGGVPSTGGSGSGSPTGGSGTTGVTMPGLGSPLGGGGLQTVTAPGVSPWQEQYRAAIERLLNQPLDVDENELYASPENRAFRLAQQRSAERERAQLAEQASQEGWSGSGGLETENRGIQSRRGESEAQFLGQLAGQQMQAQREMLIQGIQFAIADGQFDKAQELQAKLANLTAALQKMGLLEQAREHDLDLGFDYTKLGVDANRDALDRALS